MISSYFMMHVSITSISNGYIKINYMNMVGMALVGQSELFRDVIKVTSGTTTPAVTATGAVARCQYCKALRNILL